MNSDIPSLLRVPYKCGCSYGPVSVEENVQWTVNGEPFSLPDNINLHSGPLYPTGELLPSSWYPGRSCKTAKTELYLLISQNSFNSFTDPSHQYRQNPLRVHPQTQRRGRVKACHVLDLRIEALWVGTVQIDANTAEYPSAVLDQVETSVAVHSSVGP